MAAIDVEAEMNRLWSDYHLARETDFHSYDFGAVLSYARELLARAQTEGLTVVAERIDNLLGYIHHAREPFLTPEERLVDYWPGLWPPAIEAALRRADEALSEGDPSKLEQASHDLEIFDQPEYIAEIAEEGLTAEFAAHIPGAIDDYGVLALSNEHEALLDRARRALDRVQKARRAQR